MYDESVCFMDYPLLNILVYEYTFAVFPLPVCPWCWFRKTWRKNLLKNKLSRYERSDKQSLTFLRANSRRAQTAACSDRARTKQRSTSCRAASQHLPNIPLPQRNAVVDVATYVYSCRRFTYRTKKNYVKQRATLERDYYSNNRGVIEGVFRLMPDVRCKESYSTAARRSILDVLRVHADSSRRMIYFSVAPKAVIVLAAMEVPRGQSKPWSMPKIHRPSGGKVLLRFFSLKGPKRLCIQTKPTYSAVLFCSGQRDGMLGLLTSFHSKHQVPKEGRGVCELVAGVGVMQGVASVGRRNDKLAN